MSRDNDRSRNTWGEDGEPEEQSDSFRDAYLDAMSQNRPGGPRSNDISQDDPAERPSRSGSRARSRGGTAGGRIYEEGNDQTGRPRPTRQSRDEVYARYRQRPRQPVYSRNQEEQDPQPPRPKRTETTAQRRDPRGDPYQQSAQPRERGEIPNARPAVPGRASRTSGREVSIPPDALYQDDDAYEEYAEYDEYDQYEDIPRRKKPPVVREPPRRRRRGRGSQVFSHIFVGCLGGVITLAIAVGVVAFLILHNTPLGQNLGIGKSAYTQAINQPLTPGNATQLIVSDQIGSVSVNVDADITSATLTGTKKVLGTSKADADSQFSKLLVTAKQINKGENPACTDNTCLLITASVPTTSSSGLLGSGNADSIDLTLALPSSFSNPSSPYTLAVSTTTGNIAVNGFNGILNLSGTTGSVDISVTGSVIFAGTCLRTTHGNITVNKGSIFDLNSPSDLVPCTNTTSKDDHPWFNISSGKGNVDVALTTLSTNLRLDASTNNGQITDDFNLNISTCSGSPCYSGPLLPGNGTPAALLYISASTGDIKIQKQ